MAITSYQVISEFPNGDKLSVTYEFTHHTGRIDTVNRTVPAGTDHDAVMQSMIPGLEQQAADQEIGEAMEKANREENPDKVAEYQPQADFDRRVLGRCTMLRDVHQFYATLPMWTAMEGRGGSNANQRASYLGITRELYDPMDDRYGEVQGIAFFLDNDSTWPELPEEFE